MHKSGLLYSAPSFMLWRNLTCHLMCCFPFLLIPLRPITCILIIFSLNALKFSSFNLCFSSCKKNQPIIQHHKVRSEIFGSNLFRAEVEFWPSIISFWKWQIFLAIFVLQMKFPNYVFNLLINLSKTCMLLGIYYLTNFWQLCLRHCGTYNNI